MFEYGVTMKLYVMVVVLGFAATTLSVAIPKPDDDHKNRVIDKELSNQDHFGDDEEHNPEYDHEAFLGKDEARSFEDLTPEQSQERLGKIYDKIDKDADKFVTQDELREWIKYVQNKYIHEDTGRQWKEHTIEDGKLSWEHYKTRTYGNVDEDAKEDDDDYNYKDMVRRDKRRWEKADGDNDGSLTQEEFAFFLHPEEAEHMREIVVEETLEDIDKDKDGLISMEEYIGDIYPGGDDEDEERPEWVQTEKDQFMTQRDKDGDGFLDHNEILQWILPEDYDHIHAEVEHLLREADTDQATGNDPWAIQELSQTFGSEQDVGGGSLVVKYMGFLDMWPNREDNEEEPDWVKTERDQFATFRDKNKDGTMDKAEVTDWIIPSDYDHSEAEAKHLILESDGDRDGKLSKEEVVAKYDLFVGSQATDFGEALARHDEF